MEYSKTLDVKRAREIIRNLNNTMKEELTDFIEQCEKANPFYDNHFFTEKDKERVKIDWRAKMWLWMYPTFVQITTAGVFHYKIVNGAYFLMKITSLEEIK